MLISSAITIVILSLILVLVLLLCFYVAAKHIQQSRSVSGRLRGKSQPLLPISNPPMSQVCDVYFEDLKRKSFYDTPRSATSTCSLSPMTIPEIRITFPEEDPLPPTPGVPGQRMSRVVVVQVGESGAAYVTAPPPYEEAGMGAL